MAKMSGASIVLPTIMIKPVANRVKSIKAALAYNGIGVFNSV